MRTPCADGVAPADEPPTAGVDGQGSPRARSPPRDQRRGALPRGRSERLVQLELADGDSSHAPRDSCLSVRRRRPERLRRAAAAWPAGRVGLRAERGGAWRRRGFAVSAVRRRAREPLAVQEHRARAMVTWLQSENLRCGRYAASSRKQGLRSWAWWLSPGPWGRRASARTGCAARRVGLDHDAREVLVGGTEGLLVVAGARAKKAREDLPRGAPLRLVVGGGGRCSRRRPCPHGGLDLDAAARGGDSQVPWSASMQAATARPPEAQAPSTRARGCRRGPGGRRRPWRRGGPATRTAAAEVADVALSMAAGSAPVSASRSPDARGGAPPASGCGGHTVGSRTKSGCPCRGRPVCARRRYRRDDGSFMLALMPACSRFGPVAVLRLLVSASPSSPSRMRRRPVNADALARARRHAGVGQLLPRGRPPEASAHR